MSLSKVVVTQEVFLTMLTHALTNEAEEVMGLLLGHTAPAGDDGGGGGLVAHIRQAVPQIRTDRRKDRVETSPEQMAACSALAEAISTRSGLPTRVVGWYHSHPHITVLPSHVDVNTQALYQYLDAGFVGLIVSAFNAASGTKEQTVQLTAFQSTGGAAAGGGGAAAAGGGAQGHGLLQGLGSSELAGVLDDEEQMMQAALAASAAEQQEAARDGWQRREVPLVVAPGDGSNPSTLADYVEVQRMLLAEEVAAHQQQQAGSGSGSAVHAALQQLLDAAAHQQSLLQHADCVLAPALAALQQLRRQQAWQAQELQAENQRLREMIASQPLPPPPLPPAAAASTAAAHAGTGGAGSSSGMLGALISLDEPGGEDSSSLATAVAAAQPPGAPPVDLL